MPVSRRVLLVVSALIAITALGYWMMFTWHNDFNVYRNTADAILHGQNFYIGEPNRVNPHALPYIYPPFSALLFLPTLLIPELPAAALFIAFSAACLAIVCLYSAREWAPISGTLRNWQAWQIALPFFALAMISEIASENFKFGQINFIVAAMVIFDGLKQTKWQGFLTGVATGIKITPGIFIIFMLINRQWRQAAYAVAGFVTTVVIGLLAGPSHTFTYFRRILFETSDIVGWRKGTNVALRSVFNRELSFSEGTEAKLWLITVVIIVVAGFWVAAKWWKVNRLIGLSIIGVISGLVSPVSWVAHLVFLIPMLFVLLAIAVKCYQNKRYGFFAVNLTAFVLGYIPAAVHLLRHQIFHVTQLVWANAYAGAGLITLLAALISVPLIKSLYLTDDEDDRPNAPANTAELAVG